MARNFRGYVKRKGIGNGDYPFAILGLFTYRAIILFLKTSLVSFIFAALSTGVSGGFRMFAKSLNQPPKEAKPSSESLTGLDELDGFLDGLKSINIASWMSDKSLSLAHYLIQFAVLMFLIIAGLIVIYMFLIVLRWRAFERDCFKNDRQSEKLRKKLIQSMLVKEKIKRVKRQINKANESQGVNADTLRQENELEALTSLRNIMVTVNTRQDLSSDLIMKRYAMSISVPETEDSAEMLLQQVKNIDKIATKLAKGQVSFGEMTMSSDRTNVTFEDSIVVPDKYKRKQIATADNRVYESSFPLALFNDHSAEIEVKKDSAGAWAERTGKVLDNMLATKDTPVKRLRTETSSANALFEYEFSFKLSMDGVERLSENLNVMFKTSGATSAISDGRLQLTVPLPSEYKLPIDVPSMYREVFGSKE